ncbi:hypothetical protein [Halarcobacter anaerophilus]|uniref:hypothetical protein n=1 Tax=Halarcobacter anaerophilus TaxID=877500 RepID=UPI000697090C|nr:hypothetical protein [Halarcobacter anaerophilus]
MIKKLFNIFNKKENLIGMSYETNFHKAISRTRRLGLNLPKIDFSEERYLTEDYQEYLFKNLVNEVFNTNEIDAQCMSFNYRIREYFHEITDNNFMYTIGYVKYNDKLMFEQTEKSLKNMLNYGIQSIDGSINIHVWLTLPSMEIIDLTLATTLGKVWNKPELIGRLFTRHADEFDGMQYIPLLVGDDFLRKTGALIDIKFI